MSNNFNIGTPTTKTFSNPGHTFVKDCSELNEHNEYTEEMIDSNSVKPNEKLQIDKVKIYDKRRRGAPSRLINVSIRLSPDEYERLRLRALMLRTDCSKLIRSRLDDIISAAHICEICHKNMSIGPTEPESDGNLFDTP